MSDRSRQRGDPSAPPTASSEPGGTHDRAIARGAGVNTLGIIGKALLPAFFIVVTRLYGPAVMGLYYLVTQVIEIAISLTVSGFSDGVTMFAARDLERDGAGSDHLYRVLANSFVFVLAISAALILFAHLGAPIVLRYYPQPGVAEALCTLSWALPFIGVPTLIIAATKAHLIMHWDALLLGFLRPALLVGLAVLFFFLELGLDGLLLGYVLAQVGITAVALVVFHRHFSYRRLGRALAGLRFFRPLITFALPQNLNMTFNTLIGNLDVVVLGWFAYAPEQIAYYGIGAQIARNVRQIKLAFSGIFSPVVARYHARGDARALSESFTTVARWTTTLGLPAALAVALLREDLIRIFHDSFTVDPTFMLLLLAQPVLSCAFGLAGNIVVMTGHSLWNLINALCAAGLNLALLVVLVPIAGLPGAALATLTASAVITVAQLVEARLLVGVHLIPSQIWKPWAAIVPALAVGVAASLCSRGDSLALRLAATVGALVVFGVTLKLLGIDERDRAVLTPWKRPATID